MNNNIGSVKLIDHLGDDQRVIQVARRCYRSENKSNPQADQNLIRHLITKGHKTPFEFLVFTFDVEVPIFVARQWFRHRVASYTEESLRYCIADESFFLPAEISREEKEEWINDNLRQFKAYEKWISKGLPKEQARSLLPTGIFTKFYWNVNGSSLMNFLTLRADKHAQYEIRECANEILSLVKKVAPITFGTFEVINANK